MSRIMEREVFYNYKLYSPPALSDPYQTVQKLVSSKGYHVGTTNNIRVDRIVRGGYCRRGDGLSRGLLTVASVTP
jgi:hypothetical protein